jgi:hypothetical protein
LLNKVVVVLTDHLYEFSFEVLKFYLFKGKYIYM